MHHIYTMLDITTLVAGVRQGMRSVSPGASLLFFAIALLTLPPTLFVFWQFDLVSTYAFLMGTAMQEATPAAPIIATTVTDRTGVAISAGAVLAVIGTTATLFPTFGELLLPRFCALPLADVILKLLIGFDYITDWPTVWAGIARWGITSQFGPLAPIAHFLFALIGTLFVSLLVQMIILLQLIILFHAALNLLLGHRPPSRGATVRVLEAE